MEKIFIERLKNIGGAIQLFAQGSFGNKHDKFCMCSNGFYSIGSGMMSYEWDSDVCKVLMTYLTGSKKDSDNAFKALSIWEKERIERNHKACVANHYEYEKEKINNKLVGFIYLIKSLNLYKIGRAKTEKRIETYRTENPHGLKLITMVKVNDYVGVEKILLEKYKSKNFKGEWFKLVSSDIKEIKELLKNYEK